MSSTYANLTAWDFKGTTAKKHEEVIAARRKELQDNPGLAQQKIDDYNRWYREERVLPWQERLFKKLKGERKTPKGETCSTSEETKGGEKRESSMRSVAASDTQHSRRLSGSTLG